MKKPIKWFSIFALIALLIVSIDININRSKISPVIEDQVRIVNLLTAAVLIFIIIRFIIFRKFNRK